MCTSWGLDIVSRAGLPIEAAYVPSIDFGLGLTPVGALRFYGAGFGQLTEQGGEVYCTNSVFRDRCR